MPHYSRDYSPPGPVVSVRILSASRPEGMLEFSALIDTGSDWTTVPLQSLRGSSFENRYSWVRVKAYDGTARRAKYYWIPNPRVEYVSERGDSLCLCEPGNLRVLAGPEGLLGRDVLNSHLAELRGPEFQFRVE